jgi:hypothetical protein
MFISTKGEAIKITYEGAKLLGTLILTPKSMSAKGLMDIEGGKLISGNAMFNFQQDEVFSDDATFKQMHPKDTSKVAFETGKVKAYVHLAKKFGEFTYKYFPGINNTFILNNYAGSFEKLRWEIEPKTLEFKGPVNPKQGIKVPSDNFGKK